MSCQSAYSLPTGCGKRWKEAACPQAESWLPNTLVILMLKRIAEQQEAIRIVLDSDRKSSRLISTSWQDFEVIDLTLEALGLLNDFTDALSVEKKIIVSAIHPLLTHLRSEILQDKDNDCSLTAQLKPIVKVNLESRYSDLSLSALLDVCSLMDLRFKTFSA